ncbi:MAG: HAD family acid phosphatase [Candidatus Cohnella colombiensis]|uniref:Nucleotidase n=1 Tax=Candidatus Cohnella colombiensis TaxID=3121368 RepID=A0AA95JCQ2_9BACL|nr:MAG: HAD family acid phosphatase [Cohnella sp.]
MKFGFDIDDTLINLREHAFHIYNKKLNQNVELEQFHALDKVQIHELFGMTAEQGSEMWKSSLEEIYYTTCPPYPDAVEALQRLDREGHEIYYITARREEHGERTMKWMIDQKFPVRKDRFYYGMQDEDKVSIIEKLNLDYYFDDKPAVLMTLGHLPIQLYAKSQSYNRHLELPCITSWSQLFDEIMHKKRIEPADRDATE